MSDVLANAFRLAAELHVTQVRKGTQIPYLSHVVAVSALVMEDGGSEIAAAGALLHDAAEDQGGWPTVQRIRELCGDAVADIVVECSDSLLGTDEVKRLWRERKVAALDALPDHSEDALRVIAADKLHNAAATLADLELVGPVVWERFKTGRDGFIWYHHQMASRLAPLLPGSRSVVQLRTTMHRVAALG